MIEECDELWDDLERGHATSVVTYEAGIPASLVSVGYAFD